jgi:protein tyrosine/serine phosphatase
MVLLLIILFLPSGGLVSYVMLTEAWGNFHTVMEGFIYRSGQLTSVDLTYTIDRYRIRSILNLRGKNMGSRWYQEETYVANSHGVVHYDYGISANRELEDLDIRNILAILRTGPKPLLIHCKTGSDRTGLVAALYLHDLEGVDAQTASQQLSIMYGHFPYFWNSTAAMDRTFWRYVAHSRQP